MKIEISRPFGFSFVGRKPNNEDCLHPNPEKVSTKDSLFLVCDGVGGREKGEVASAAICEIFSRCIQGNFIEPFSQADFKSALAEVYNRLNELEDSGVVHKMGSTLSFLKFHSGGAMIAHIGDSRVYHIRPTAKQPILFRTEDHSLVATMVKAGMITSEEAAVHPKRNVIHRAVQPHQTEPAEADIFETADLKQGDYFFLCSDGVLENLTDQVLVSILQSSG
jgi:serine/threonine protein phosphatase PrpC